MVHHLKKLSMNGFSINCGSAGNCDFVTLDPYHIFFVTQKYFCRASGRHLEHKIFARQKFYRLLAKIYVKC